MCSANGEEVKTEVNLSQHRSYTAVSTSDQAWKEAQLIETSVNAKIFAFRYLLIQIGQA